MNKSELAQKMMDYELGDLSDKEVLELFSELISSGIVWSMQGVYGRTATWLIENQLITSEGEIINNNE